MTVKNDDERPAYYFDKYGKPCSSWQTPEAKRERYTILTCLILLVVGLLFPTVGAGILGLIMFLGGAAFFIWLRTRFF